MDFIPSHRLASRLVAQPNQADTALAQPIPVFAAIKRRSGLRHYPRCSFRGFYDPEMERGHPHMWTADQAAVECHFLATVKVQYIWIEIGNTSPQGANVQIFANDELVAAVTNVRSRSTICAKLSEPRIVSSMSINIKTTTFVPGKLLVQSEDGRELGVALRTIVFAKRRTKYRPRSYAQDGLNARVFQMVRKLWNRKAA